MGDYKANQIVFARKLLQSRPPGDEEAFLAELTPEEERIYRSALNSTWLPIELSARITDKAMKHLYPGDIQEAYHRFGGELAKHDLSGIYQFIVRIVSVNFLLQQTARLWSSYHRQGSMRCDSGNRTATLILEGYPDFPQANHELLIGYIRGAAERAGGKDVKVTGDASDPNARRYALTWS